MICAGQNAIAEQHEHLSKLDGAIGDGDHGTTMQRVTGIITQTIADNSDTPAKATMKAVGWAVMGSDGGSVGPLMGSMFVGFSDALEDEDGFDTALLCEMLIGGIDKMHKLSKASVGDKTMMDVLLPVRDCLQEAEAGATIAEVLARASDVAQKGAAATEGMVAKFGRARNLGERVIGHPDPGATSMSLMFAGFVQALPTTAD